jgi:hypothetical protein
MSHLPDVTKPIKDGLDELLILYNKQVWKDLLLLG